MVKAYVHTVVDPAVDYWKHTIEVKKGAQVERMKRVRIFNPLHVLTNKIWVSDIEGASRLDDIQVVSAPSDDGADWGHEKRSHNLPDASWLHQVIGGKEGWQGTGHFW
jgi:hypothetical protein